MINNDDIIDKLIVFVQFFFFASSSSSSSSTSTLQFLFRRSFYIEIEKKNPICDSDTKKIGLL